MLLRFISQNFPKYLLLRSKYDTLRNIANFSYHQKNKENKENRYERNFPNNKYLLTISTIIGSSFLYFFNQSKIEAFQNTTNDDQSNIEPNIEPGLEIESLPTFTLDQVSKHSNPAQSVWIVFKAGVYDVTEFVKIHPGGDYILLAAGNSIEPFWKIYGQHNTQQVYKLLESFRIGNLRKEDRLSTEDIHAQSDLLEYIPPRNEKLIIHHNKPFNAETPLDELIKSFITSNENFFVRNHLSVPEVNTDNYELEIEGISLENTVIITLDDLKNLFPKHSVVSVVQCAGNRRESFNAIKEVKGIAWTGGAIGNAKWSGARLVDVLNYCGANLKDKNIKHVQFEGLDLDATSTPYGASVPSDKALDPMNNFLVAYEMNDQAIPADHGFPVRLIAPGIVGARNVKWLGKIILSEKESDSHWQRRDYKSFPPSVDSANEDEFDKAYAIQELPIQSVICVPKPNEEIAIEWKPTQNGNSAKPFLEIKGYAWSGGGRSVIRVDISVDNGQTWINCDLDGEKSTSPSHTYSWVLWKGEIPLKVDQLYQGRKVEVICRAWDCSYNTQPKDAEEIWNFRGLLNNSWHRVCFTQK